MNATVDTADSSVSRATSARARRPVWSVGALLAGLLLASGCAAASPPAAPSGGAGTTPSGGAGTTPSGEAAASTAPETGSAEASIGGREFAFTLTRCGLYQDEEVELAGIGGEKGSQVPSHLDGGLMGMDATVTGEFRIDIGTSDAFTSSEEFLAFGAPTGENLAVSRDGDEFVVTADAWDDQGTDLGTATMRFTCR